MHSQTPQKQFHQVPNVKVLKFRKFPLEHLKVIREPVHKYTTLLECLKATCESVCMQYSIVGVSIGLNDILSYYFMNVHVRKLRLRKCMTAEGHTFGFRVLFTSKYGQGAHSSGFISTGG